MKKYIKATFEDDYAQMVEPEFTYSVNGYYDGDFRGLVDTFSGDYFSEAIGKVHDFASSGYFVTIKNNRTGATKSYTPDAWADAVGLGDYPESIWRVE